MRRLSARTRRVIRRVRRASSPATGSPTPEREVARVAFAILVLVAAVAARAIAAGPIAPGGRRFDATAYSVEGKTAEGTRTREGIVAADPALLPLGTRIRVRDAGRYSGDYVVRDMGRTITGREIDLHLADDAAAKRFGRKLVDVEVLGRGTTGRSPGRAARALTRPSSRPAH